jgi:hypothetical protein
MADRVAVPARGPARISKGKLTTVATLLVVAVALRFLIHYALPYFRFDPAYFDYYWPHRIRLIFHICGGILALSCGPFQFWTGLRRRAMAFHVWTGRLYLVGVAVGSTGAFLMGVFSTPRNFGVALMFMASAWILITGIAYAAIIRGLVSLHKEWMVRSYLLTFGFVTFRLVNDSLPGLARYLGGEFNDRGANLAWACWLVPVGIFELILQSRRIFAAKQHT